MNGSSPYWSSMGMTTPAAYSNWGWKYGASPYGQGGGGGGSPLSYQLQSTYPQGYPQPMATMPGAGMQMDPQMYMQQYYLPSLLSGEQTR